MFKDIHCHLLPGIDDGSSTFEETLNLLKKAEKEGVSEIILTPHYIENTKYNCNNDSKKELFRSLQQKISENNINIKIYLGNEAYISENLIELMQNKEIMTLNNSRYLLFEFPINQVCQNAKDIIYELVSMGCIPILAHPERYKEFQKHPEIAKEYARMGVLLQGNYKSLLGKYGKEAKKTLKTYLKMGLISFLGSDMHQSGDYSIQKARKKVKSIVKDNEIVENLFWRNFDKVIKDEDFNITR